MVNDRGYSDGVTVPPYANRMQIFEIVVDAAAGPAISTRRRFDPEGVRVGRNGHIFISDEYGPYICEFDQTGRRIPKIDVPAKFQIANPDANEPWKLPETNRAAKPIAGWRVWRSVRTAAPSSA